MQQSRREFIQGSAAVAAAVAAAGLPSEAKAAEAPRKRPNLVFFLGEGQRADAMSIAGQPGAPGDGLRLMRLADPSGDPQTQSVQPFGFRVSTDMITVPGRVLPTPSVIYGKGGKPVRAQNGSWNSAEQKFYIPGKFTRWQVLVLNRKGNRGNALGKFFMFYVSAPLLLGHSPRAVW